MTYRILEGDCIEQMRELDAESVDAVVCDPPYNLSFMSRAWDRIDGESVDPAFLHWFAGFVDGEGCFSVHRKTSTGYETFDCQFSITLRADDRPILERIQRTLGMGTLSKPTAHRSGEDNPKARYSISRKADCLRLRELLRAFPLRAKKAKDLELWSDALDAWVEHEPGNGWDDVAEARALLMASRAYVEEGVRVDPFQMWCWRWGREAMRVLKPGGHLLAMGGTRTYHRLTAGLEDAGFEIRDSLIWIYGSGFPKSLDVGKAIDRANGTEHLREFKEKNPADRPYTHEAGETSTGWQSPPRPDKTHAYSDEAQQWQGWGTALKPAHEPIVVARKPLAGTVAANVLEHGTGALNIDGTRIGGDGGTRSDTRGEQQGVTYASGALAGDYGEVVPGLGRWPANVALSPEAAAELDRQSGELTSGTGAIRKQAPGAFGLGGDGEPNACEYGDTGGASRFVSTFAPIESGNEPRFRYQAKASRSERNAGLDGFEERSSATRNTSGRRFNPICDHTGERIQTCECGSCEWSEATNPRTANHHPTVKPIDLMRWLVRLVTPPGGTCLDPFMGSGTTGIAAHLEGFDFIGIEREAEYAEIARARIEWWSRIPPGTDTDVALGLEGRERVVRESGQLGLDVA